MGNMVMGKNMDMDMDIKINNQKNMKQFKFTIFTPVYNGAKTFYRVFESLQNSTYKNFEWIIINDGSTDNSDEVIRNFINGIDWDIKYIDHDKNQGKHIIWNEAVKLASGDLWLPIDCDDAFVPNSLEFYNEKWNEYCNDSEVYGIDTLCFNPIDDSVIGSLYPFEGKKTTYLEMRHKYHVTGEKWGTVRLEYLKKVLFPELPGHFFTGPILWNTLGMKYKVIPFNQKLRKYYIEPSSICHSRVLHKNTVDMFLFYYKWLIKHFGWYILKTDFKGFIKMSNLILHYIAWHYIMTILKIKSIQK